MYLDEKWRKNKGWLLYAAFSVLLHFLVLNWMKGITFQRIEPDREIVFNFEKSEETSQNKPKKIEVKETEKKVIEPAPLEKSIPKRFYEIPDREIDPQTKVSMYHDSLPESPKEDTLGKTPLFYGPQKGAPKRKFPKTKNQGPTLQRKSYLKFGKKNLDSLPKPDLRPESQGDLPVSLTPPSPRPKPSDQKSLTSLLSHLDQYIDPDDYADEGMTMGDGISFSFEDKSFGRYVWYGRIIIKKVKDGWFPPYVATVLGLTGKTVIKFSIMKNGEVRHLKIKESSGNPSLDNAALNAVKSAIPFSQLPDDYNHPKLGIVFSFWYNLRPSGT